MDSLGLALIVGGAALVARGLVLLLPGPRKRPTRRQTVDESREQVDSGLQEMRRQRGDLS
jgi:hypothetical protein